MLKEKLQKANEFLLKADGRLSYKTILLEVVPEILDLDINQTSATELVGQNYWLYDLVKREHKDEYSALLDALALSVPYSEQ